MWLYIDERKVDLCCKAYSKEGDRTYEISQLSSSYYDTYYEVAAFTVDFELLCEMSNAKTIAFEIENNSQSPIIGVFSERNFIALKNYVNKVRH